MALCRAVAVAGVAGPERALAIVDELGLDHFYLFHAIRADLLKRMGRSAEAIAAYSQAIHRTENETERAFLERAREEASHGQAG